MNENIHNDIKALTNNISSKLQNVSDAGSNTYNHDKQLTDISSKHTMMNHHIEIKFQANVYPSENSILKLEEELTPFEKYL